MKKNEQKICGKNNIQVGENYGYIITSQKVQVKTEIKYDETKYISPEQQLRIRNEVAELVEMLVPKNSPNQSIRHTLFQRVWGNFKREFKIPVYKLLPKEKFDEAMKFFKKKKAIKGIPNLRKNNEDQWRIKTQQGIHARRAKLNISKDSLYSYISLILKKEVSSLKELTSDELKQIYDMLHRK